MRPVSFPLSIAVLSLSIASDVSGQRSGLGLKGGILISELRSEVAQYAPALGGTLGAYVPYRIGSSVEIQPELMITGFGTVQQFNEADPITYRTYYLQVPVSLKYFMSNTFNIHGGVLAGKRLMATTYDANGATNSSSDFNNMDFGLITGLGMDLASSMDLTLRYYYGVSSVLADDQIVFPRYRSIQFTVGKRLMRFKPVKRSRR